MDKFEELLKELSPLIGTDLVPDKLSTCLLVFENSAKIQLELDRSGDNLLIGSSLGEVPPGKYREQLLIEALKSNKAPHHGILAFSLKKQTLILFLKLPFDGVGATNLFTLLQEMSKKAEIWQTALQRGALPPQAPGSSSEPSIFNLQR